MDREALNAHLDAVLIGGREPAEIVLAEYDAAWPERFERERKRVLAALGSVAIRVEHIGSTAVPGLAAKPIVDVLVTVAEPDDEAAFVPALEAAGYELRVREPGTGCSAPRGVTFTCTCGPTATERSDDTSLSATVCAPQPRTAPPTSASSASSLSATGRI